MFLYIVEDLKFMPAEVSLANVAAFSLLDYDVSVVVAYHLPSKVAEENARLVDFLLQFYVGRVVVISWDFNLLSLN